jgi:hemolysin D
VRDKPQDKPKEQQQGAEPESSEPNGQELSYMTRVSLDQTTMQVEERVVDLTLGMAVAVEIKTGSRRVITYLLSRC